MKSPLRFILCALVLLLVAFVDTVSAATAAAAAVTSSSDHTLWIVIALGVTLTSTHPTLLDFMSSLDPDNKVGRIIELLAMQNEVLDDMVVIEGNLPTGHQSIVRTGIPTPTWRKLYGGVQPSKATQVKVTDSCGMLENYAEVDKALADLNGNAPSFRLSQNLPILEGFNQEVCSSLFYANEDTEPEAFTGLAPRFNSLSAANGQNIVSGSGSGSDNTSIWLTVWGPNTLHAFYPKGSSAGLQMRDLGEVTVENVDGSNGRAQMYRTHYRWDIGLAVLDWRYIVRIANIDVSELTKDASSGADIIDLMTQALELVQSLSMGRPAFYCNRTVKSYLRRQMVAKVKSSTLMMDQVGGKHVMTFDGVPVRRCDSITNTEAAVS